MTLNTKKWVNKWGARQQNNQTTKHHTPNNTSPKVTVAGFVLKFVLKIAAFGNLQNVG